jgi:hypothetical protein
LTGEANSTLNTIRMLNWTVNDASCTVGQVPVGIGTVHATNNGYISCNTPGEKVLTLTARDNASAIMTDTASFSVSAALLIVEANGPYAGQKQKNITLIGAASDSNGSIQTIQWSVNDSSCALTQTNNGLDVYFTSARQANGTINCSTTGTRTVNLTVTKFQESAWDATTLTITLNGTLPENPPTVHANGPYELLIGEAIEVVGRASDTDGTLTSLDWSVDSSDCTITPHRIGLGTSTATNNATINCTTDDTFTLTLTAKDNQLLTTTDTAGLDVYAEGSFCGDAVCDDIEDCESCPGDCEACPDNCDPVPEDCTNAIDDDCDNRIDCSDVSCNADAACGSSPVIFKGSSPSVFKGGSPLVLKGSSSPLLLKGSSPLFLKGNNNTNTTNTTNTTNRTNPPPRQVTVAEASFGQGIVRVSSFGRPAITALSSGPSGNIFAFALRNSTNSSNLSVYYFGTDGIVLLKNAAAGWMQSAWVRDSVETNKYVLPSALDGDYALVAVMQPLPDNQSNQTNTTNPPPIETPAETSFPWLFIIVGVIVILGALVFFFRNKILPMKFKPSLHQEHSMIGSHSDEPLLSEPRVIAPHESASPRLEAKRMLQAEILKGKSMDDAKIELMKKGWNAKVINQAVKDVNEAHIK